MKPGASNMMKLRQRVRQWLPLSLQKKLRTVEDVYQHRLYRLGHLKVWLSGHLSLPAASDMSEQSRILYQRVLLDWLRRAQDAVTGGGVAGYYTFSSGWSAAYPETTGYIIVTCIDAADRLQDEDLLTRARCMADWELEVQLPEGAWQSGFASAPRIPAVFNTGQVIQGLLAAYARFGEGQYLEAAIRGGRWLISNQEDDGAWRRHTYNNFPNSYSTRVAWPLLILAEVTSEAGFRRCAMRYLQWAMRCQTENGWLEQCTFEVDEPALTHTLAYAVEGFLESGIVLRDDRWIAIGQRTADMLLHRYEIRHHLAGSYDRNWHGDHSFSCLTGCAQMSRVWGRLFEITGDARYLNAALKLNDFVLSSIDLRSSNPGIHGGVKGSHPIWGAYMTWRLPSWAVKFTLDALFQERDALTRLKGNSVEHHNSMWTS
jgi:uncharacterized protein YyaL (SSP411 family)